ncbi:hypothetical protein ACWEQL_40345 [Kitasatospora sp. NPDC004240]
MDELRRWSGLTYRQIARQAEECGDVLPPSTLCTALGRRTLPQARVVIAFVRACAGEGEVQAWAAAYESVARAEHALRQVGADGPDRSRAGDGVARNGPAPKADPVLAGPHRPPLPRALAVGACSFVCGAAVMRVLWVARRGRRGRGGSKPLPPR